MLFLNLLILSLKIQYGAFQVFCNNNGAPNWWCAKEQPEGQKVSSAVAADSCFCLTNQAQTQQQALDSCSTMGGFLTDVQNADENNLIGILLNKTNIMSANCPPEASYFDGFCYVYNYQSKKSWQDAENYCQSTYNGHLASIHSVEQQNFMFELSRNCLGCSIYGYWVGGNNYGDPTTWKWSDGSSMDQFPRVTKYKGWAAQPDDPKNQQCMTIVQPDGGWGDFFCSWSQPFHCQFPATGLTAMIGLQKTISGHSWSIGNNCQMNAATYQGWKSFGENSNLPAYVYTMSGAWSSVSSSTSSTTAVCRLDTPFQCGSSASSSNWWCAKDQAQGQSVVSAVTADSCFCLMNKIQSQQQAFDSCKTAGGFLTDVQNSEENQLLGTFLNSAVTDNTNNNACPQGSTYFDGSCYVYQSSMKKTWQDAETYCQKTYSGHLASVHSNQQQQFLYNTLTRSCQGCTIYGFWVGGFNGGNASNWRWSDGSKMEQFPQVTRYKGWAQQPDGPTTQQCMTLVQPDGGWGDWYCSISQEFVCQLNPSSHWIALQKTITGYYWNIGDMCQMTPATYQGWDPANEVGTMSAYAYVRNSKWSSLSMNATASSAICRLDRNICARNNCPSCNMCRPTNSNMCSSCSSVTSVTGSSVSSNTESFGTATVSVAASTITPPPVSALLCNTVGQTTKWWCAKDSPIGQNVSSAVQADSCFCIMYQNQNQQAAFDSCTQTGGYLTDIQNSDENNLIGTLMKMIATSGNLPNSACPDNAYYFDGYCYVYVTNVKRAWQDAENYCQTTYNGHLPVIRSVEQQNFIFQNVSQKCQSCSIYGLWVGGNNYGDPSNWRWSDGTAVDKFPVVTNYTGWARQPDDPKTQQCMTIVQPDGGWGDLYCSFTQPFPCQFPVPASNAWIGLQKTLSGHNWNIGPNCQANSAMYQGWSQASESASKTAYTYTANGWQSMTQNATVGAAVCRLDRNICGRNPCGSCSTCTPTTGGKCFSCSQSTSSTSASSTLKPSQPNPSFACGSTASNTNWWCAKEQAQGQSVTSAVTADSCFCLMNKNQNQQQAFDSCNNVGGFLTDIQNSEENQLIGNLLDMARSSASDNSLCPSGATYSNGFCYIYQSIQKKTWYDAETYCQTTYNGHLASILSAQEQDFLFNNLSKTCTGCNIYGFWVGGNNGGDPNNWKWSDGTKIKFPQVKVTGYKGWAPQPDGPTTQQCMTIVQPDGGWGDWYCSLAQPFACKFPIASTWIGLQKILSGQYWSVGGNMCQMVPAAYQNWDRNADSETNTAYMYKTKDLFWSSSSSNSATSLAICRLDRNICGRNACPTCNPCRPTVNSTMCSSSCSGVSSATSMSSDTSASTMSGSTVSTVSTSSGSQSSTMSTLSTSSGSQPSTMSTLSTSSGSQPSTMSTLSTSSVSTVSTSSRSSGSTNSTTSSRSTVSTVSSTSSRSSGSTNSTTSSRSTVSTVSSTSSSSSKTTTTAKVLLDGQCGQTPIKPNIPLLATSRLRIINGETAVPNSWPWTVFIFWDAGDGTGTMCGGSLINKAGTTTQTDIVVTAAHCVTDENGVARSPSSLTVFSGAHSSPTSAIDNTVNRVGVSQVHVHTGWNPQTNSNDLAVLKLASSITFNNNMQPVCLPKAAQQPSNANSCVAVGWGRISNTNTTTASVLQQVRMPVFSDTDCTSPNVYGGTVDIASGLCAGYLDGTKSACQGDSGGPLICMEGTSWTLYGATSYGGQQMPDGSVICATQNRPTVYTRISSYISFIQQWAI